MRYTDIADAQALVEEAAEKLDQAWACVEDAGGAIDAEWNILFSALDGIRDALLSLEPSPPVPFYDTVEERDL